MRLNQFSVRDIPRRKFLEISMKGGIAVAATPALISHLTSCKPVEDTMTVLDTDKDVS